MGFYKKTVVLSNQGNYEKGMAILTIEKNNSGVFGSLKFFDIPKLNNLVLGISVNGSQAIKQNIVLSNGNVFNFKLNNDFNIDGKIGSVLANIMDEKVDVLIWGTNGDKAEYKQDIIHIFEKDLNQKRTMQNNIKVANKDTIIDFDNKENDMEIKPCEQDEKQLFEVEDDELEEIIDKELEKENSFFGLIGNQIDQLFATFPEDTQLSNIIPDSKWVKVDYENNGKEYVFGLIYENDEIKYICYGVPGNIDELPPDELMPYSQWLSIDDNNGYWLMYQDALTGDNILIDEA